MADSILHTVKNYLGVELDYGGFDSQLIVNINTALMTLNQLNVGPAAGFSISDATSTWADLLGVATNLDAVQTYVCLKVKSYFDPPTTSFLLDAIKNQLTELEARIFIQTDPDPVVPVPEE